MLLHLLVILLKFEEVFDLGKTLGCFKISIKKKQQAYARRNLENYRKNAVSNYLG